MDVLLDTIELLKSLRLEIERLGMEDSPSRTEYEKKRDKDLAPSPSTLMARTDLTWSQIMQLIGLRYDGAVLLKDRAYADDDFPVMNRGEKMDYLFDRIDRYGLNNDGWYRIMNIVDESIVGNANSTRVRAKYVGSSFKDKTRDEQIEYVAEYIQLSNIKDSSEYKKMRDKTKTPSMSYIFQNLGGWKAIKQAYDDKYGRNS